MLCPLHKGITIGKIKMEVLERVQLITGEGRCNQNSKDTVVATHEQEMPANSLPVNPEDMEGIGLPQDECMNFDESHRFKVTLPLERSLNKARQSVETDHLKVFHNLKIYVNLHNPDGHVSQVCVKTKLTYLSTDLISQLLVRNLVHIFISPNLPVGDDQMIQGDAAQVAQMTHSNEAGVVEAPPTYERHQLDQLYDDIDPANFLSGANTPFYGISRNPSNENLNGLMDATANTTLQSRLAALQDRPDSVLIDDEFAHPSPRASMSVPNGRFLAPGANGATSFRGSYHQYLHPQVANGLQPGGLPSNTGYFPVLAPNGQYDMEALARIPSYNTAVRTPVVTPPESERGGLPTVCLAKSNLQFTISLLICS
jgi:hypothetical protein